jgi:hypothetical protein
MTRVLRLIGYWDGRSAPDGWPDVCDSVTAVDGVVQQTVARYLRSGTWFVAAAGVSLCRLCGTANGNAEQTDGVHFVWPEGLVHYVEKHGVRLPDEFADIAARGVASAVDPERFASALRSGDVTVDGEWWRRRAGSGQTGRSAAHLAGCRRSTTVASWDLPDRAEIYVDRVPQGAVKTLVELRRLLGTAWSFSDLRSLLGSQPFHAVTGDPAALSRTLSTNPELRPYLFYANGGTLLPIWSGS